MPISHTIVTGATAVANQFKENLMTRLKGYLSAKSFLKFTTNIEVS